MRGKADEKSAKEWTFWSMTERIVEVQRRIAEKEPSGVEVVGIEPTSKHAKEEGATCLVT